jgi:hypothetical protein
MSNGGQKVQDSLATNHSIRQAIFELDTKVVPLWYGTYSLQTQLFNYASSISPKLVHG